MAESVVVLEDQLHNSHKYFCHICSVEVDNVTAVSIEHLFSIVQIKIVKHFGMLTSSVFTLAYSTKYTGN